jgi:hypothetical protein
MIPVSTNKNILLCMLGVAIAVMLFERYLLILDSKEKNTTVPRESTVIQQLTATDNQIIQSEETISFTIVSGGLEYTTNETVILIKSILIQCSAPVELNIVTEVDSKHFLINNVLRELKLLKKSLTVNFVILDLMWVKELARKNNIKIRHHSGEWGIAKIYLPHILPSVGRTIFVDTDMIFLTDPLLLWKKFSSFDSNTIIMWHKPSGDTTNHICSCIMLWDFERSRQSMWEIEIAPTAFKKYLKPFPDGTYNAGGGGGDQDFIWAIAKLRPDMFQYFGLDWNIQNCYEFFGVHPTSLQRDNSKLFPGAIHFNCMSNAYNNFAGWEWVVNYMIWYRWDWLSTPYEMDNQEATNVEQKTLDTPVDYPF